MAVERKQYTAEFKREAVRLMEEGGLSAVQVAHDLGINRNLLGKWKRHLARAKRHKPPDAMAMRHSPAKDEPMMKNWLACGGRTRPSRWNGMC